MKVTPHFSEMRHRAPGREKPASADTHPSRVAPKRSARANARQALERLWSPGRTPSRAFASHSWRGSASMNSPRHISRRMPRRTFSLETTPNSLARSRTTPFSRAIPSWSPKNSICAVPMFVMSEQSGSAMSQRWAISPGWFVPISRTRKSASFGQLRMVIGSPMWLLKLPSVAWTLPTVERNALTSSFVVVLPAEPVMATTFALSERRYSFATRSSSSYPSMIPAAPFSRACGM